MEKISKSMLGLQQSFSQETKKKLAVNWGNFLLILPKIVENFFWRLVSSSNLILDTCSWWEKLDQDIQDIQEDWSFSEFSSISRILVNSRFSGFSKVLDALFSPELVDMCMCSHINTSSKPYKYRFYFLDQQIMEYLFMHYLCTFVFFY